jgi:polyisoprenoid-binding protein YceI
MNKHTLLPLLLLVVASAHAGPATRTADPDPTHASFEVDHYGDLPSSCDTFKQSTGEPQHAATVKRGSIDVFIDTDSVNLGQDRFNEPLTNPVLLSVIKVPTPENKGRFDEISNDPPKSIVGEVTLPGFRKPMSLSINSFKCIEHPTIKNQACETDAIGSFNHADLAVNDGPQSGFKQDALLRLQFQGIKVN